MDSLAILFIPLTVVLTYIMWKDSMTTNGKPVPPPTIDELIEQWSAARSEYDRYLYAAYENYENEKRPSEDRAKLKARMRMREDGLPDPDALRMRIWARIGVRVVDTS